MTKLVEKLEALGDANKYDEQAAVFLDATSATIEARYIRTGAHFPDDTEKKNRDIYEIRITRGSREFMFMFGENVRETIERITGLLGDGDKLLADHIRMDSGSVNIGGAHGFRLRLKKWEAEHKDWQPAGTGNRPDAYSILACMTTSEPPDNADDFAAEYGYEKPSEAIRVFEAVRNEWENMQKLFTDDELDALSRIA